ncbi:hypothetical protein ACFVX3_32830 [Rhodococcus erythropolis]
MERYKFTFADGSSTEKASDSDNEAIMAARATRRSWRRGQRGDRGGDDRQPRQHLGLARPVLRPPRVVVSHDVAFLAYRGTRCPRIRATSAARALALE